MQQVVILVLIRVSILKIVFLLKVVLMMWFLEKQLEVLGILIMVRQLYVKVQKVIGIILDSVLKWYMFVLLLVLCIIELVLRNMFVLKKLWVSRWKIVRVVLVGFKFVVSIMQLIWFIVDLVRIFLMFFFVELIQVLNNKVMVLMIVIVNEVVFVWVQIL